MNADLMPFDFEGHEIRTVTIDGEPWFVAKDVMAILGLTNPTMAMAGLDEDEFTTTELTDSLDRSQQTYIVNESGLYSLILRSRKPEAKAFKKWITSVLLPQIRKTGSYGTAPMTREELLSRAVIEATTALAEKDERIKELEPKARTWDTFLSATGDYSVNEAAKVLSRDRGILTGQGRLFAFMEKQRWIYRDQKGKPVPYQAQIDNGRLIAKAQFHYHPESGEVVADAPQVRVTAKGLEALHAKLTEKAS